MLKRFSSKSSNRRSSSSKQSQQSQRSSAQTLISLPYSPDSSAQPTQARPPSTPRTSDQAPYPLTRTSASLSHTPHSSASASTPPTYPKHSLSPPSSDIPYDHTSWTHHNQLIANLALKADHLDALASLAETRWKAAEAALPPSRRHEVGIFAKIPVLQEIHGLLRSIRKLLRKEKRWTEVWKPRSPLLRYPAWGCCYAEAVGVYEGEGVTAWDVGVELDGRVEWLIAVIGRI